jgi:uncharacterized membrane protein YadS
MAARQETSTQIRFILGLALIASMAVVVSELDGAISGWFKARGFAKNPLDHPLVAAVLGLAVNGILRATTTHDWIKPTIKTSLFKIGPALLGARISPGKILTYGAGGLIQAVMMVTCVFFSWWLASRLKLPETLKAVMATAVPVCGVSTAIAAAGAVLAKKREVTYVTAPVIITALPTMVLMPWIAQAVGLPEDVVGAWFGRNIDTMAAMLRGCSLPTGSVFRRRRGTQTRRPAQRGRHLAALSRIRAGVLAHLPARLSKGL